MSEFATNEAVPVRRRRKISLDNQVKVLFRDGWLCRWCGRPTIFSPTLRLLQLFVSRSGNQAPLAYYHPNWRRDTAPLLDHMGAVIDHVEAFATGGADELKNLATACNKCNARKNRRTVPEFQEAHPLRRVKGRFGEPKTWDGLTAVFLSLAEGGMTLTSTEKAWKAALTRRLTASRA